jgi:hypothetical protein
MKTQGINKDNILLQERCHKAQLIQDNMIIKANLAINPQTIGYHKIFVFIHNHTISPRSITNNSSGSHNHKIKLNFVHVNKDKQVINFNNK